MSNTTKQEGNTDSYSLFLGALDVINEALSSLRDKPLIKDIMSLMDKQTAGEKFGVEIYTDNPDTPHDYYTVRANNQRLELVSRGKDAPSIDWKVSTEYLQDINENPQKYIDNPLKLDIDWLKHRLSDAA
ncbi:MAG: hypothetical protein KDI09_01405 [Halioglobus sp.]|nr:hypothetical protein [Halioglobus sp.]